MSFFFLLHLSFFPSFFFHSFLFLFLPLHHHLYLFLSSSLPHPPFYSSVSLYVFFSFAVLSLLQMSFYVSYLGFSGLPESEAWCLFINYSHFQRLFLPLTFEYFPHSFLLELRLDVLELLFFLVSWFFSLFLSL